MIAFLENSPIGQLVPVGDGQRALVPNPLPRSIEMDSSLVYRLDEASRAVATLAGVGETIPNPHLLTQPFLRREAVLSSRIEGTQASLSDLYLYEASKKTRIDVLEVHNYVKALEEGIELLDQLPICIRLINSLHATLLSGVRGEQERPGEIRTEQVWIGKPGTPLKEAEFVPPPPSDVPDALGDWERFANEEFRMPPLVQCALLHYQFEAIHPYRDGNGRIGRLLIILFLYARKILPVPLLYLSAYFERDRQRYYDELLSVSVTGDWDAWLHYFLNGVIQQSNDSLRRARQIRELHEEYRGKVLDRRGSANSLKMADLLFTRPYVTTPAASAELGITDVGARRILDKFVEMGVLHLIPNTWPRVYGALELVRMIDAPEAQPAKSLSDNLNCSW